MRPFQVYKKELQRLIEKAGIGGMWDISFVSNEDIGDAQARCTYDTRERWVRFAFNVEHGPKTATEATRIAKHEFGHFVTARLDEYAIARFVSEAEIGEACEEVARVFERIL